MTEPELERDLVDLCKVAAKAMGAYVELISQRGGKNSGTTKGAPDCFLYVAGRCIPIEFKTRTGRLSVQQIADKQRRWEHGVHTFIIRNLDEFVDVVNMARRGTIHGRLPKSRPFLSDATAARSD